MGGALALGLVGYLAVLATSSAPTSRPLVDARMLGESPVAASLVAPVVAPVAGPVAGSAAAPAEVLAPASAVSSTVSADWVASTSAATGIPVPAVRAYAAAQLASDPACALGWTTLAGIGWVESHHGTIEGRTIGEDAQPSAPILGIPLGELDRAYGPMQFIPSTWAVWGADGDGDGVADPQDLDDAALAAAHYLCHSGVLSSAPVWSAAIFSYNHSDEYVQQVYRAAQEYADRATQGDRGGKRTK